MERIIVTVRDPQQRFLYDLEIPTDLEGEKLADDIVQTINGCDPSLYLQSMKARIVCERTNTILKPDETAEGAGIHNGDYLTVMFQTG